MKRARRRPASSRRCAGCGCGARRRRDDAAERGRRSRSRATSARKPLGTPTLGERARGRDGDAAAAAQLRRRDPLRRRLRAVDRGRSAGGARAAAASTGSTTSTASRPSEGAADAQGRRRRPHLVGPPRLGRRAAHPGRGRLVPRAVPVRRRRQAAPAARSCARRGGAPCDEVETRLQDAGVDGHLALGRRQPAGREVLRVVVGPWTESRSDPAARQLGEGPAASGVFARPDAPATGSSCSTSAATVVRDARPRRRPAWRRRASRTSSRPGSSPAPTTPASRRPRPALREDVLAQPLRGRRRRAAARVPLPIRRRSADDLPAPRQPAARRPRGRRRGVVPGARGRRALARAPARARRAARRRAGRRGRGARVRRPVLRALAWGVPFALVIALVNALVTRDGLTVLVRGCDAARARPARHHARGGRLRRACSALRVARRDRAARLLLGGGRPRRPAARAAAACPFRSALTAALATRMVPVLARDARRLADAQRCRRRRAGVAAGARARGDGRARWTARSTSPRRSRCAATARRARPGAPAAAVVAARPRLRRLGASALVGARAWRRAGGLGAVRGLPARSAPRGRAACWRSRPRWPACVLLPFADRRGIGG